MTDTSEPRLAPIPVEEWGEDAQTALRQVWADLADRLFSGDPDAPPLSNVLAVLMHHPDLAGPWLSYSDVLLRAPTIEPRHRELMILRVAWRTRSMYEWAQHVRYSKRFGITDDEIAAIGRGADADVWTPLEADLLAATDQMLDRYCIDDATWARLAEEFEKHQLVELTFVVGTYTCLAMAFNSFGLELNTHLDPNEAPPLPEWEE